MVHLHHCDAHRVVPQDFNWTMRWRDQDWTLWDWWRQVSQQRIQYQGELALWSSLLPLLHKNVHIYAGLLNFLFKWLLSHCQEMSLGMGWEIKYLFWLNKSLWQWKRQTKVVWVSLMQFLSNLNKVCFSDEFTGQLNSSSWDKFTCSSTDLLNSAFSMSLTWDLAYPTVAPEGKPSEESTRVVVF